MQDKSKDTDKIFISTMRSEIKSKREAIGKSIYTISAEASVPRSTWRDFEFEVTQDTSILNFCKMSEGIGEFPWDFLKEIYEKSGKNFSLTDLDK